MNESLESESQSTEPPAVDPDLTPDQLRRKLSFPSRCLAIISFVSCFTDSIAIWNILGNDLSKMIEYHGYGWGLAIGVAGVIAMLLLIFVHFWIGVTALKMPELKNYSTMRLAAITASIPFITPIVFLGLPFGLWLYSILRKPAAQAAVQVSINANPDSVAG